MLPLDGILIFTVFFSSRPTLLKQAAYLQKQMLLYNFFLIIYSVKCGNILNFSPNLAKYIKYTEVMLESLSIIPHLYYEKQILV